MAENDTKPPPASPEPKIAREHVLHEHPSGSPHITVDEGGTFRHYCGHTPASGQVMQVIPIVVLTDPVKSTVNRSSGPAKVTSDAYRSGWDAVRWGRRGEDKPS